MAQVRHVLYHSGGSGVIVDYTLTIVHVNGVTRTEECATSTDVCNFIASNMRSSFASDLDRGHITFHVTDNTKTR